MNLRSKEQPAPLRTEKQTAKRKSIPWLALSGGIGFSIGGAIGGAIWFAFEVPHSCSLLTFAVVESRQSSKHLPGNSFAILYKLDEHWLVRTRTSLKRIRCLWGRETHAERLNVHRRQKQC